MWQTVIETRQFIQDAEVLFRADERDELIRYLARYPEAGDVMPGTGGIRKPRWAAKGKGTRGGARVIYYYLDARAPLFLLAAFSKNRKIDLTPAERNHLRSITAQIKRAYRT